MNQILMMTQFSNFEVRIIIKIELRSAIRIQIKCLNLIIIQINKRNFHRSKQQMSEAFKKQKELKQTISTQTTQNHRNQEVKKVIYLKLINKIQISGFYQRQRIRKWQIRNCRCSIAQPMIILAIKTGFMSNENHSKNYNKTINIIIQYHKIIWLLMIKGKFTCYWNWGQRKGDFIRYQKKKKILIKYGKFYY